MVNMDVIRERLMKGAFVGVGAFASSFIENVIEQNLFDNEFAIGASELAVGAGLSVGVDMFFDNPSSLPNDAVEYAGYGIQGAAWSSMADAIQTGQLAGSQTVSFSADAGTQTGQQVTVERQEAEGDDFMAEVA